MSKKANKDDGFIVPVGNDGELAVTDEMRQDAAASVANMEVTQPYLYLANADAKVVVEREEARAGDFVILGAGESAINLGKEAMFICISHHVRFNYYEGKGSDRKFVWDCAREAMNDEQARQADLDWSDPRSARPYDSYTLIHVAGSEIDPHGVGPIRWKSSANSAAESKKFKQAIVNTANKGVPAFSAVWLFKGRLKDTGHGGKKYTWDAHLAGAIPAGSEAYTKLKETWQHEQIALNKAKMQTHTGDTEPTAREQKAVASVREQFTDSDAYDYTTRDLPEYGDEDAPF